MKWMIKFNFMLILCYIINEVSSSSFHIRLKQINYKDQYQQCLEDYKKMYNSMDEKLKFFSDNEHSLLNSVKSTIFKAYEKTENLTKQNKLEVENLLITIKNLEVKISSKENEINSMKNYYEKKLNDLADEIKLKSSIIENISTELKVFKEDNIKSNKKIENLNNEISMHKLNMFKKENSLNEKIKDCADNLETLNKSKQYLENEKDSNMMLLEMKSKVIKSKGITSDDIVNQITRGEKISTNLKLIEEKLNKNNINAFHSFNSTIISESNEKLEQVANTTDTKKSELTEQDKFRKEFEIDKLDRYQHKLFKQLDLILFNIIDKSRFIYTKIQKFNDLLSVNLQKREKCELNLKKVIVENLEMKEALAELEMKIRVSK